MAAPHAAALRDLAPALRAVTGRPASSDVLRQFERYLDLLLLWNRTHRLTGLRSPLDVVRKLFVDSLLVLPLLPERPLRLVDIGTGAGIPGVPLRVADPLIALTLVEARRKKVSFLSALKRELGLDDVRILHGRAEDLIAQHIDLKEKFDVAVMRAVSNEERVVSAALEYVTPGGLLLVSGPEDATSWVPPAIQGAQRVEVPYPALGLKRNFLKIRAKVDRPE